MGYVKILNTIEKRSYEEMYESIVTVLANREDIITDLSNNLNLLKYTEEKDVLNKLDEIEIELNRVDEEINKVLKNTVIDLLTKVTIALKECSPYLNNKNHIILFKKRGRIIAQNVQNKIGEIIDETEEFTKFLYDLIEEVKGSIKIDEITTDISIEEMIDKHKTRHEHLLSRMLVDKYLKNNGYLFLRHGSNHDIYFKKGCREIEVPRHRKISIGVSKSIQDTVHNQN